MLFNCIRIHSRTSIYSFAGTADLVTDWHNSLDTLLPGHHQIVPLATDLRHQSAGVQASVETVIIEVFSTVYPTTIKLEMPIQNKCYYCALCVV